MWRLGRLDLAGEGYAAALRVLHDLTRTQLTARDKDAGGSCRTSRPARPWHWHMPNGQKRQRSP